MKLYAYPGSHPLGAGTQLSIVGSPAVGMSVVIEYPKNEKAGGTVVSYGPNILEISIDEKQWRLDPLDPSEVLNPITTDGGLPSATWIVQ
jgi:hypothetical protein